MSNKLPKEPSETSTEGRKEAPAEAPNGTSIDACKAPAKVPSGSTSDAPDNALNTKPKAPAKEPSEAQKNAPDEPDASFQGLFSIPTDASADAPKSAPGVSSKIANKEPGTSYYIPIAPDSIPVYQPTTVPTPPFLPIIPAPDDLKPIETERLILRPLDINSESDAQGIFQLRSRKDFTEYLNVSVALIITSVTDFENRGPRGDTLCLFFCLTLLRRHEPNTTIDETKDWMNKRLFTIRDASCVDHKRHFYFTVHQKSTSESESNSKRGTDGSGIIGVVGVTYHTVASAHIALHPDYWRKGYGTEALKAVVSEWWRLPRFEIEVWREKDSRDAEMLYAATLSENIASRKVLKKVGFTEYVRQYLPEVVVDHEVVRAYMMRRWPGYEETPVEKFWRLLGWPTRDMTQEVVQRL